MISKIIFYCAVGVAIIIVGGIALGIIRLTIADVQLATENANALNAWGTSFNRLLWFVGLLIVFYGARYFSAIYLAQTDQRWRHKAICLLCATFLLWFLSAWVTNTEHGVHQFYQVRLARFFTCLLPVIAGVIHSFERPEEFADATQ